MSAARPLTFFHNPQSRAAGVRILFEELGTTDYTLKLLDFNKGEQRAPEYLAVNPMGKVPALLDGDALITEQVAIYIYLADRFPKAGLAPALDDALRGPYLRWIAYYGSCFEPATIDRYLKHEPAPAAMNPYGDYDTMFKTLTDHMAGGDWFLGERFSAVDVLWGAALGWMVQFKLVPEQPVIKGFLDRFNARPAVQRAREKDAALLSAG